MDVQKRIRDLLARTKERGASEEEAQTALEMAARLMAEHGIEKDKLGERSEVGYGDFQKFASYCYFLARACSHLYGVTPVSYGDKQVRFAGRPENVRASEDTYRWLIDQVERLYKVALPKRMTQSERSQFRREFKQACAWGVECRALKFKQAPTTGKALIVHHSVLEKETWDFLEQKGVKKKRSSKTVKDTDAALAGFNAANNVKLHRPIEE